MMRTLPLNQSQGINYEVTHNHLNQFFWVHDLHDNTIKHLQCHPTPVSSNRTPTNNSGSSYITSTVHHNPFGEVNQWGMPVTTPTFTPSPCISLQTITSTPIYTMDVNSSSRRIEKFSERLGTTSLREFKATFSTVVCELEFKYGINYTKAFTFKQLAHYVHYEALDIYVSEDFGCHLDPQFS